MKNCKPMVGYKPVATWLPEKDLEQLQNLARENNVTVASYLRAIIVDVLQDENYTIQSTNSTNLHQLELQIK